MKNQKAEIIKVDDSRKCYICMGKKKECRACGGTGIFKEYHYIHVVGNIAFGGDTLK